MAGLNNKVSEWGRYLTFQGLFRGMYCLHARKPVQEHKVLFVEVREPQISNSFQLLYKKLKKDGRYRIHVHYLRSGFVSRLEYTRRCTAMLKDLADAIPCNPQYLCRFFKELAGVSPIQYLINYRIERACGLLANTSLPILRIAMDCGFDNVSYFIRKFKEARGCTPKEFRETSKISQAFNP